MSKYTQTPNRQPLQLHYFKMKVYDRAKYMHRTKAERRDHCQDETPLRQQDQDAYYDSTVALQVVTFVAPFRMGMHADTTSGIASHLS